jgi:hypothetical protein
MERKNEEGGENYAIGYFIFLTPHQMMCYRDYHGKGDDFGGELEECIKLLVGNPERKKELGKPRRRW